MEIPVTANPFLPPLSGAPSPITEPLLSWYYENARELPWRQTTDPYRIWVSEVMLQQTRVEAVKPYYARFLASFPTIEALASAEEDKVLKLWEGLGYYSRARNMQKAARLLVAEYGGRFPRNVQALLTLPGIGSYTAGAIASIAMGLPVPAVDGNVLRVLSRLCNCPLDIALPQTRKLAEAALFSTMPADAPGAFTQALMELGACVCLPNAAPLCESCPLLPLCLGRAAHAERALPIKSRKAPRRIEQHTVFVLRQSEAFALRRRESKGLLAGLYELPNLPGHLNELEMAHALSEFHIFPKGAIACYTAKHVFTHVEWHMRVYSLHTGAQSLPTGWEWATEHTGHALPTAFKICL